MLNVNKISLQKMRLIVRRSRSLPPQRHQEVLILRRSYSLDSVYDTENETSYERSRLALFQRWCHNDIQLDPTLVLTHLIDHQKAPLIGMIQTNDQKDSKK